MSTNDRNAQLSALTAHSNLPAVCRKYNISKQDIQSIIDEEVIKITDARIPIYDRKGVGDKWIEVKESVIKILKAKLMENQEVALLLAVVRNVNGFTEAISNAIVSQLQSQYKDQGFFNWAFGMTIIRHISKYCFR
jgi:hypothetical protein